MAVKSVEHIRQRHMRRIAVDSRQVSCEDDTRAARIMEDDMEQKFTTMAQEAIGDAIQSASAAGNAQVDTLHVMDALLRQENGVILSLIHI